MSIEIAQLGGEVDDRIVHGLVDVLIDSVAGGASVGWTAPPSRVEAETWWREQLAASNLEVWIARDDAGRILGTVSLQLATKKNGRHRAEVAKLMVHRDGRGQGISTKLMGVLEAFALEQGRTLLLLDTETGSLAESLYKRWGWQVYGKVEGYTIADDGSMSGSTFMLKRLG
jgi:GNAT superfamily N-acetyltransferase